MKVTEVEAMSVRVRGRAPQSCAACGDTDSLAPDPRCGGVLFCSDCRDRSTDLTEWDDLGVGD